MKYIIDIPKTVVMTEKVGSVHYTYFDGIQCKTIILKSDEIEELNSDYINEHYGQLQDEAYQRGYKDCETRYCSFDACPNRQAEYQRGLDDAWEAAKKISLMSPDEIEKVFPGAAKYNRYNLGYSGVEVIAKLKAYEEKQKADDEIKVGDEVKWNSDVIVVTRLYKDGGFDWCDGISKDGIAFHVLAENVCKTGKHIDIASILEEINDEP